MSLRLPPAADPARVNLYSDRFVLRQVPFAARFSLIFIGVLLLALSGLALYWQDANQEQARLLAAQGQRLSMLQSQRDKLIARYGPDVQSAWENQRQALQAEIDERRFLLQLLSLHVASQNPAEVLNALGRGIVPGIWLTRMRGDAGSLVLEGRTLRAATIPLYVERLHVQPALADLTLAGITASNGVTAAASSTPSAALLDFRITAAARSPERP
ncbi:MAG: PilN domain-containing protein [Burkholderiales bacterium]